VDAADATTARPLAFAPGPQAVVGSKPTRAWVVFAAVTPGAVVFEEFAGEIDPRSIGIVETAETHILSVMP
jgi:hypothetical protein